ncbi:hypothetical protein ACFTWH_15975 [Streptomyces sp. NPDC057011]|uniref:hypothetical protein n=1 Tax=unclassified Streptomyces TaxID=2593676 RepID=UPI003640A33C
MKNRLVVIGSAVAASIGLCMAVAPAAMAQPLKVTVACGDVAALLTAVSDANDNADGGTITLAKDCAYRFTEGFGGSDSALPAITGKVKIVGHNSTLIRSATDGLPLFRIISVSEGGELLLKGVTVTGGHAEVYGGGIENAGTLRLEDSKVAGNRAGAEGGGIHNVGGTATLVDSDVLTNVATSADGTATGDGGGISNEADSTLTIKKSTIAGNAADTDGGGIENEGSLTVEHGLIANNEAREGNGGGIDNLGTAKLKYTKVVENWAGQNGGGINNGEEATLETNESAIADNRAGNDGGGLNNAGTATLKKTKVESNQAGHDGGGINNVAAGDGATELTLEHSTVAENRAANVGGGINNGEGATVTLTDSKVVKNLPTNCAGTVPGCTT